MLVLIHMAVVVHMLVLVHMLALAGIPVQMANLVSDQKIVYLPPLCIYFPSIGLLSWPCLVLASSYILQLLCFLPLLYHADLALLALLP